MAQRRRTQSFRRRYTPRFSRFRSAPRRRRSTRRFTPKNNKMKWIFIALAVVFVLVKKDWLKEKIEKIFPKKV